MGRYARRFHWWVHRLIPCIGGNIADWFAYSQTVAVANKEKDSGASIGQGHVRGVIGCEGANNAQKATSYVPLFCLVYHAILLKLL